MRARTHSSHVRVSVNPVDMDYLRYGRHASGIRWGDRATFDFDASGELVALTYNGKSHAPERVKLHALHEITREAKACAARFSARSPTAGR